MKVLLEAIKFNYDPEAAGTDALNVRKNETTPVAVPEWRRGRNVGPEDSTAVYALEETRGNTLTIQAKFKCTDHGMTYFEVRAIDARTHPRQSSSSTPLTFLTWLTRPIWRGVAGSVLGGVKEQYVFPERGETEYVTFELQDVRIWEVGVGVHDISWRWQFRRDSAGPWVDFAESAHRIYTVLRQPRPPWQDGLADPTSTQLPWTEVLDYACRWAAGAHNPDDAAALVTHRVFELGPDIVHYDNVNNANLSFTTEREFDCTSFLKRLRGEDYLHDKVNCTDCATIVSTFANCVGCDLSQSSIVPQGDLSEFPLGQHRRIGLPGFFAGHFYYHEVAWEGEGLEDDEVFDACLQVDGDDAPGSFTPLQPTNLRFGRLGEPAYRFRLARAGMEGSCGPFPDSKRRRRVGYGAPVGFAGPDTALKFLRAVRKDVFERVAKARRPGAHLFVRDFFLGPHSLAGWKLLQLQQFKIEGRTPASRSFWKKLEDGSDTVLRLDVSEHPSSEAAADSLLRVLAGFELPGVEFVGDKIIGGLAFANSSFYVILFMSGNLVFLLRNTGRDATVLTKVAESLNQSLLKFSPAAEVEGLAPAARFSFDKGETRVGCERRILEEAPDPLARRRFYKFYSALGETYLDDRGLSYRPAEPGRNVLKINAVDANGDAIGQELPLEVLE